MSLEETINPMNLTLVYETLAHLCEESGRINLVAGNNASAKALVERVAQFRSLARAVPRVLGSLGPVRAGPLGHAKREEVVKPLTALPLSRSLSATECAEIDVRSREGSRPVAEPVAAAAALQRICRIAFASPVDAITEAAREDWPGDFAHENGRYECRCTACGRIFCGHKRRITCRLCAELVAPITFDQLVACGIEQGVPCYDGLPWSFTFGGFPVTHENNDTYLIMYPTGTIRVNRPIAPVPDSPFTEADVEAAREVYETAPYNDNIDIHEVMNFAFTRALASGAVVRKAEHEAKMSVTIASTDKNVAYHRARARSAGRVHDDALHNLDTTQRKLDAALRDGERNARVLGLLRDSTDPATGMTAVRVALLSAGWREDGLAAAIAKADEIAAQEFPTP